MELPIQSGRGRSVASPRVRGFTLIELLIVMSIIVVLVSIALPLYQRSIMRAKESVLHSNLMTLRTAIDEYTYDKQKAPQALQDLAQEGYLRQVPLDPMLTREGPHLRRWRLQLNITREELEAIRT